MHSCSFLVLTESEPKSWWLLDVPNPLNLNLPVTVMFVWMHAKPFQSCPTLFDHMNCILPDFSVHGVLQARILECVAVFFSRASYWGIKNFPGIELISPTASAQQADSLLLSHQGNPNLCMKRKWEWKWSHSVVSDSLWPHELQHARPPCPSPTPRVYPNSCPFELAMPSSHLILCHPLLLLPPIPPSIRVFSN